MKNIIIIIMCICGSTSLLIGQNTIHIQGGNLVQTGGHLVVKDATLSNDGTFTATSGNVKMTGTATDANSAIGGTSSITFNNLTIDKSSNNVTLNQGITINNDLIFQSGLLDIQTSDITIAPSASITNYNSNAYIRTSSTGTVARTVGASSTFFPIGKENYSPASLVNSGVSDVFTARVNDEVRVDDVSGSIVTNDNVDLTWYVEEETLGGSDVSLTFQWDATNELTGFDRNACFVSHYDGADWSENTAGIATGTNPYQRTLANVSDFSPFTVTSNINVLPVELISFTARKAGRNAQLDWLTATEINNDYFDVEWSIDGEHFEPIGSVRGAGTTNIEQEYRHLHRETMIGLNYYRLKQVDFDGLFEYSQIEVLNFAKEDILSLKVSPNPSADYCFIQADNYQGLFQILDQQGRLVQEGTINGLTEVDISRLAPGIYYVHAGSMTQKLVVN